MLTFSGTQTLYGTLTSNQTSANLTTGAILTNEGYRYMLGATNWPFLEATYSGVTVAAQQFYALPGDYRKLDDVTITVGTTVYRPKEVTNRKDWDFVNSTSTIQSNIPQFYYIYAGTIGFWPTPSSSALVMTINYKKRVRDISIADYTTGTIVSVAAAGLAVVGSGTAWTTTMAGRYIRITYSDVTNKGDGIWYQIASVQSATTLTLSRPYSGTAIAAGAAAYAICDCMLIPEDYQNAPVYYAAGVYWAKENNISLADRFTNMFEESKVQMLSDMGNKTTDPVVDDGENNYIVNPNLTLYQT